MELAVALGRGAALVARHGDEEEELEAVVRVTPSRVVIYVKTEGTQTLSVFGAPWHVGRVSLARADAGGVVRALGCARNSGVMVALRAAVGSFFADEAMTLSDLLDVLDAEGVPYAYGSFCSLGMLLRPDGCVSEAHCSRIASAFARRYETV